jgi:acyl dehydratase
VSQTLRFAAPVYVRDEVVAQVQAVHIRAMAAANGSMTSRNVYVQRSHPLQEYMRSNLASVSSHIRSFAA